MNIHQKLHWLEFDSKKKVITKQTHKKNNINGDQVLIKTKEFIMVHTNQGTLS